MRHHKVQRLVVAVLAVLCMGGTCRDETLQSAATTFFDELAIAAADAFLSAAADR